MRESVNHPSHYQKEGHKECIEEMIEMYGARAVWCFCICNAHKYEYRAGLKGDAEEDLKKAQWYRDYAEKLEKESAAVLLLSALFNKEREVNHD